MTLELRTVRKILADDCTGETEVVGISSGCVYEEGEHLARYLAWWFPQSLRELVIAVTIGPREAVVVAVRCPVGDPARYRFVSEDQQPWGHADECLHPEQVVGHSLGVRALELLPFILREDPALSRYLAATAPIPFDPGEVERDEPYRKAVPEAPEPSYIAPAATMGIAELARQFDRRMQPWAGTYQVAPPTAASIAYIGSALRLDLPKTFCEFAKRSECFGTWFAGIGEDYGNPLHILTLNDLFHDAVRMSDVPMPQHLIMINHGHDEDCDCFDLRRERQANGEYWLRYWSPGVAEWDSYPTFLAYVEDFLRKRER